MYVTCEKCGRTYNDTHKWTICPHEHIGGPSYPVKPMNQKPTIGRILHYVLSQTDVDTANRQSQVGPVATVGEHLPLIVVEFDPGDAYSVAGTVFLRGGGTLYVRSRAEGTEPHTWHWPERD